MTAYGAVISLENTIKYIYHSSHFSESSLDIILLAYNELLPWQLILLKLDGTGISRSRKKVNALDRRIKDLIWELEDKLESLLTDQILSQIHAEQVDEEINTNSVLSQQFQCQNPPTNQQELTSNIGKRDNYKGDHSKSRRKYQSSQSRSSRVGGKMLFSIDLRRLQDDVDSFIKSLKDMKEEYIDELHNMAEDDEAVSSTIDFGGISSKMIGLSDQFEELKNWLMSLYIGSVRCDTYGWYHVQALVGMAGIGKTTLAKKLYEDLQIFSIFECRVWATIGRKPQLSQISRDILAQLCGVTLIEEIGDHWIQRLEGKKCLIVLDDVWETQVLCSLLSLLSRVEKRRITIFLTARDESVIQYNTIDEVWHFSMLVRFLNGEESKDLLCEKVFGEEICPPQLDKAAYKIAKNCEGLPLMIVTVADIVSKSEHNRDPDYWNDVAEERNSVFKDAYDEISKVLFPSYNYLPQYLKMPFLFLGVFPREYDTPPSKIMNMFSAEGWFLDTNTKEYFEVSFWESLDKLCTDKNLLLFSKTSLYEDGTTINHRKYKTCWLHSSWRHVCRGEARKNKFYHVLNKLIDAEEEGLKGQRGLCLENNILFGITEFCNSVTLNCASSTRFVLFLGPYHQYPIPIDVGFRFLRELDALQLRFYTFPIEIVTLIHLKYLALTCNGELPTTISKLFNLQVLIIHPHMNIRYCGNPSYVPLQIWDMQELEHIEILGKSIVAPYHVAFLEKLLTIVGVNASICTILELSRRIPNIRKLSATIELTPYDNDNDLLSCFGCISTLKSLYTLKCSILNPVAKSGYVVPTTPSSLMLPHRLRKLHLSGMGFPWEYMNVIGFLPDLAVLKLRSYAFRGPTWEAREGSFSKLEFLLIEDTDLVYLNFRSGEFHLLRNISLKHCYKLERIHLATHVDRNMVCKIQLVDCNPLALTCAKQLHMAPFSRLDVTAFVSFHEKPMTINLQRNYADDKFTYVDDDGDLADGGEDTDKNDDKDLVDLEEYDEGNIYVDDVDEESNSSV